MTTENRIFIQYICTELSKKRKEKGLKIVAIAKEMDVKHPYIVNILNGNVTASLDQLQKVGEILGLTKDEFNIIVLKAKFYDIAEFAKSISSNIDHKKIDDFIKNIKGE